LGKFYKFIDIETFFLPLNMLNHWPGRHIHISYRIENSTTPRVYSTVSTPMQPYNVPGFCVQGQCSTTTSLEH
jgi:hypothetical protein